MRTPQIPRALRPARPARPARPPRTSFGLVLRFLLPATLAIPLLNACGGGESTSGGTTTTTATTTIGTGGAGGSTTTTPIPVCVRPTAYTPPPACGTGDYAWSSLLPDPKSPEFDAALEQKATRIDRQFHALNGFATGLNSDVTVPLDAAAARDAIAAFLASDEGWDFEATSGLPVPSAIGAWAQSPGAYGGPGAAADAFRYGTLRDQGADCAAIEVAKTHLLADLDALHLATAITGVPGVIARGIARKDLPGDGASPTTPLFDADGKPLPPEKDNGTWREDNSGGQFPDYVWIDSCSRDMLVGWAVGYAAVWEVIRLDPAFPDDKKKRLQADAEAIVRSLMVVGDKGYDLEIHDADGRLTYFPYLNENAIDTSYLAGANNGSLAMMALGIVGGLAYVAEKTDIDEYLYGQLVGERKLGELAKTNAIGLSLGTKSNYSNYNMAFDSAWLAHRYLCDDASRAVVRDAEETALYARPGDERQPIEQKQTFYDFVHVATAGGATPEAGLGVVDQPAINNGIETLGEFADAPLWEVARQNCDQAEIDSALCVAEDGTTLHLLGYVGRNGTLVSDEPVPMRTRPFSNYFWRTDPYLVNGDADGTRLLPAADFRVAYWMGRWVRR